MSGLSTIAIALAFFAPLVGAQDEQPLFKSGTSVVHIDVQAELPGGVIPDLKREDFIIFDENVQQRATYFSHSTEPLSLLILLDVSGSMSKSIDALARASKSALASLKPGDRVAVMVFARGQKLTQEFTTDFASVSEHIAAAVNDTSIGSATLINHGISAAADYMHSNVTKGQRSILIVTDNLGLNYQLNDEQTLKKLHSANVVLNAIVTGRARRPEEAKSRFMNPDFTPSNVFLLSDETGGEAFKPERMDTALSSIFERIRNRYSLEYSAPQGTPGVYRRIRVSLSPEASRRFPGARLRARAGYYSAD